MNQDKQDPQPQDEATKGGVTPEQEADAMERAQKEAAEERSEERGYQ